jgi:hypothetical protein
MVSNRLQDLDVAKQNRYQKTITGAAASMNYGIKKCAPELSPARVLIPERR